MSLFQLFFQIDYYFCIIFGFIFNFSLIWLIFNKTPKEMFQHSRILFQNCILDIIFLIMEIFGQLVSLEFFKLINE